LRPLWAANYGREKAAKRNRRDTSPTRRQTLDEASCKYTTYTLKPRNVCGQARMGSPFKQVRSQECQTPGNCAESVGNVAYTCPNTAAAVIKGQSDSIIYALGFVK
jgi:hypothetical protein